MGVELLIEEYRKTFLPSDWEWRLGQKEVILHIINVYLEGKEKYVVCECPTGSGKSHIAMCVSYVLNKLSHKGYILTSDIALQNQYENDIYLCNMRWGSVKGIDRYMCTENDEPCSIGVCKMKRQRACDLSCYESCPYYSARDKASKSHSSVLNYSYWLVQMNECQENEKVYFPIRDFIICDEAHKITDIVQSHFAPKISLSYIDKIKELKDFLELHNNYEYHEVCDYISNIINAFFKLEGNDKIYTLIKHLHLYLDKLNGCSEYIADRVTKLFPNQIPPSEWRKVMRCLSFFMSLCNTFETYLGMVEKTSIDSIIKNQSSETEITLNFLYTNFMIEEYFLKYSKFGIFLSATIGEINEFNNEMKIDNCSYVKIPSSFNYSESPILFYNTHKMSYNNMIENMPWLIDKIDSILNENIGVRGMIHSSSYDLALKIFNGVSDTNKNRILLYSNAEEKERCIFDMKNSKDKVLIGPSLIEGVNLPGDQCRFLIFAKVPYLSLGDNFVKAKMRLSPKWYQMKAIINILQGVGRGVRYDNDWCRTYILDANFGDLYSRNRLAFPNEFKDRISIHK